MKPARNQGLALAFPRSVPARAAAAPTDLCSGAGEAPCADATSSPIASPQDFGVSPPVRFLSDDEWEKLERAKRKEQIRQTWSEVPSHQLKWWCAPELEAAALAWEPDRSLVLLGPTASGKTSAAMRLVHKLCKRAVDLGDPHITPARSLCWVDAGKLTRAGGEDTDEARERLRRAGRARVLVLDDLAQGSKTIQDVLRERLSRKLPTVLTSGVRSRAELEVALGGDAVLRHLREATGIEGPIIVATTKPPRRKP